MLGMSLHSEVCVGMDESSWHGWPSLCLCLAQQGRQQGGRETTEGCILIPLLSLRNCSQCLWALLEAQHPRALGLYTSICFMSRFPLRSADLDDQPLWQSAPHWAQVHTVTRLNYLPVLPHAARLSFHLFL